MTTYYIARRSENLGRRSNEFARHSDASTPVYPDTVTVVVFREDTGVTSNTTLTKQGFNDGAAYYSGSVSGGNTDWLYWSAATGAWTVILNTSGSPPFGTSGYQLEASSASVAYGSYSWWDDSIDTGLDVSVSS